MNNDDAKHREIERLWEEAAGRVQSDEDIDVLLEARGLMVAEMGDVTATDRRQAIDAGAPVHLGLRGGSWLQASVVCHFADHVLLASRARPRERIVVPEHAIIGFVDLPRVLHAEMPTGNAKDESWQSTLRGLLGHGITIEMGSVILAGQLSWVGRDHLTVDTERGSITCMWRAVDVLRFDYRTSSSDSASP